MYNRIALIKDHPRISKAWNVWFKLNRITVGTWPALFRTKAHKRRKVRVVKAAERFQRRVVDEFGIVDWRIKRIDGLGIAIIWDAGDQNV